MSLKGIIVLALAFAISGCTVRPKPMTWAEIEGRVKSDLRDMFLDNEPITGPVDMYQALARSLKYNLDERVKIMEVALAAGQLDLDQYGMLPNLVMRAGYTTRSNVLGSASQNVFTGATSLATSTSTDNQRATSSIDYVWNTLDIGTAILQGEQHANDVLIADSRRRRVMQNIFLDVRYAYWRTVAAVRLSDRLDQLVARAQRAVRHSKHVGRHKLMPLLDSLKYQKALLDTIRQLNKQRRQLGLAKTELAALMNVRPNTAYELVIPHSRDMIVPFLAETVSKIEKTAMLMRPELWEEDYNVRNSAIEIKKAYWDVFPSVLGRASPFNSDSNSFLFNQVWGQASFEVSTNLFRLLSTGDRVKFAERKVDFYRMRRLALGMAILAQVNLGLERYAIAEKEYKSLKDLSIVSAKVARHVQAQKDAELEDELELIRQKADALLSCIKRYAAYAELQNAFGRLLHSIGVDPLPITTKSHTVDVLATALRTADERMQTKPGVYKLPMPGSHKAAYDEERTELQFLPKSSSTVQEASMGMSKPLEATAVSKPPAKATPAA